MNFMKLFDLKKVVSLFLVSAFLLPSLFSCGPKGGASGSDSSGDGPEQTQELYSPNGAPEDSTVVFTSYPEGNYLADAKFDTDDPLPAYDCDTSFDFGCPIASDGTTVFTAVIAEDGNTYMMFYDKASGITSPLCGKPECFHDEADCGAYLCGNMESVVSLSVYDGMLYWAQWRGSVRLFRSKTDGTAREELKTFPGGNSTTAFLHRGYLYIKNLSSTIVDEKPVTNTTLTAYPLDGGDAVPILSFDSYDMTVKPLGNTIYIMAKNVEGRDLGINEWGTEEYELYAWDTKTRRADLLASEKTEEFCLSIASQDFIPVRGDGIYFQSMMEYKDDEGSWTSYASVRKYSFASGKVEEVVPRLSCEDFDRFFFLTFLSGQIFGRGISKTLGVCVYATDLDGKLTASHEINSAFLTPGSHMYEVVGVDGENVYYNCYNASTDNYERFVLAMPISASRPNEGVRISK